MTRSVAGVLILLDLAFMGVVGQRVWLRYQVVNTPPPPPLDAFADAPPPPASDPTALSTTTVDGIPPVNLSTTTVSPDVSAAIPADPPTVSTPTAIVPVAAVTDTRKRRIRFQYVNPAAKRVSLIADFNDWKGQAFRRSQSGVWSLVVDLSAGDYTYNFIVDGRTIRDPSQRRSDEKGHSLLRVSPLPATH